MVSDGEYCMSIDSTYEYFQKYIENDKDKFVEIKRLNSLAQNKELFILTFIDEKDYFWIYQARIHENVIIYYQFFSKTYSKKFNEYGVFPCLSKLINFATICHLYLFMTLITTVMINYWFFQFQEWEFFTRFYHLIL